LQVVIDMYREGGKC